MDKKKLRTFFLNKRLACSEQEILTNTASLSLFLYDLEKWRNAETILTYMPIKNEINAWRIASSYQPQKKILLPRCNPKILGLIDIFLVPDTKNLIAGTYKIPEPTPKYYKYFKTVPDIIITPGLAFDSLGFRLGYGGGYYDRFMAKFPQSLRIALAHEWQFTNKLPIENWDLPCDIIITEKQIYHFKRSNK